jgi:hypothetical protein
MPSLSSHQSSSISKILLEGDSSTGKTTSLASLVADGFKLRIRDWDNGLEGLIQEIKRRCPEKLDNVQFVTLRDKHTATDLGPMVFSPDAFVRGVKLADKWEDGSTPSEWGPDYIWVDDSLTHLSKAAYNWAKLMTGNIAHIDGVPMAKKEGDPRNIFFTAQQAVLNQMAALTSSSFNTNLIVISHIKYSERPDGTTKGFPLSVGTAIGPEILTYFNNHVLGFEATTMQGGNTRRIIRSKSSFMLDLKTSLPVQAELDAFDGLSKFFQRKPNA